MCVCVCVCVSVCALVALVDGCIFWSSDCKSTFLGFYLGPWACRAGVAFWPTLLNAVSRQGSCGNARRVQGSA